jgi:hypothetical protein
VTEQSFKDLIFYNNIGGGGSVRPGFRAKEDWAMSPFKIIHDMEALVETMSRIEKDLWRYLHCTDPRLQPDTRRVLRELSDRVGSIQCGIGVSVRRYLERSSGPRPPVKEED